MQGINKVILVGTLGADPELRQLDGGGSVTNISIATSEKWVDKQSGEHREATEWHRVALFNRLGEVANQYLRKGSKVYIEGKIKTRKWQDNNGQDRYTTEVMASQMQMLGDGNNGGNNTTYNRGQAPQNNQQQPNQGFNNQQQANRGFQNQQPQNQGFQNQQQAPQNNQQQPPIQNGSFAGNNPVASDGFNNQNTGSVGTNDTPRDDDIPF